MSKLKKMMVLLLVVAFAITLGACSNNEQGKKGGKTAQAEQEADGHERDEGGERLAEQPGVHQRDAEGEDRHLEGDPERAQ